MVGIPNSYALTLFVLHSDLSLSNKGQKLFLIRPISLNVFPPLEKAPRPSPPWKTLSSIVWNHLLHQIHVILTRRIFWAEIIALKRAFCVGVTTSQQLVFRNGEDQIPNQHQQDMKYTTLYAVVFFVKRCTLQPGYVSRKGNLPMYQLLAPKWHHLMTADQDNYAHSEALQANKVSKLGVNLTFRVLERESRIKFLEELRYDCITVWIPCIAIFLAVTEGIQWTTPSWRTYANVSKMFI